MYYVPLRTRATPSGKIKKWPRFVFTIHTKACATITNKSSRSRTPPPWIIHDKTLRKMRASHDCGTNEHKSGSCWWAQQGQSSLLLMLFAPYHWLRPRFSSLTSQCSAPNQCSKSSDIWQDSTSIMRFCLSLPWLDSNSKCTKSSENILCRFCSLHHKFVSGEAERRREYLPKKIVDLWVLIFPYFNSKSISTYKSSSRISSTCVQCNSCIIGQIYRNLTIFFSLKIKSNQRQEQQLSESTNDFCFQFRLAWELGSS